MAATDTETEAQKQLENAFSGFVASYSYDKKPEAGDKDRADRDLLTAESVLSNALKLFGIKEESVAPIIEEIRGGVDKKNLAGVGATDNGTEVVVNSPAAMKSIEVSAGKTLADVFAHDAPAHAEPAAATPAAAPAPSPEAAGDPAYLGAIKTIAGPKNGELAGQLAVAIAAESKSPDGDPKVIESLKNQLGPLLNVGVIEQTRPNGIISDALKNAIKTLDPDAVGPAYQLAANPGNGQFHTNLTLELRDGEFGIMKNLDKIPGTEGDIKTIVAATIKAEQNFNPTGEFGSDVLKKDADVSIEALVSRLATLATERDHGAAAPPPASPAAPSADRPENIIVNKTEALKAIGIDELLKSQGIDINTPDGLSAAEQAFRKITHIAEATPPTPILSEDGKSGPLVDAVKRQILMSKGAITVPEGGFPSPDLTPDEQSKLTALYAGHPPTDLKELTAELQKAHTALDKALVAEDAALKKDAKIGILGVAASDVAMHTVTDGDLGAVKDKLNATLDTTHKLADAPTFDGINAAEVKATRLELNKALGTKLPGADSSALTLADAAAIEAFEKQQHMETQPLAEVLAKLQAVTGKTIADLGRTILKNAARDGGGLTEAAAELAVAHPVVAHPREPDHTPPH